MLPINEIICGHNVDVLATFPDACIDLTVTSPPYDNLRTYKGFTFDFEGIAQQLYRVTKPGGVVVWVVADATVNGSETGTSFRQALWFMELGFNLHDTMIYAKENEVCLNHNRCEQAFEYMFVLSKGKPKTFNAPMVPTKTAGKVYSKARPNKAYMDENTSSRPRMELITTKEVKQKDNIWFYTVGGDNFGEHAAAFPEKLAEDHILSWSNPDDIVLDPFMGSGTTAKMAIKHHRRYIGIDVSPEYVDLARKRIAAVQPVMFDMVSL